ncbi:hypothetical protein ACH5RR_025028 [Cinchona calisaya]|uniref:Protein MIZU-KUSSEI 1 n=1 Tax=Cinchona calisaya TaxID=153742 RepID=A0ABD2YZ65_9GENT
MAKNIQDLASKRQFHWTTKVSNEDEVVSKTNKSSTKTGDQEVKGDKDKVKNEDDKQVQESSASAATANVTRKKLQAIAVSRLKSVLTAFGRQRAHFQQGLGTRVVGTLFGNRRGHVHFAFQKDPNSQPVFLIELATPITGLVREMASGLVRIALECDKEEKKPTRLLEEPVWRTYCNGKKCGFATRRDCGPKDWNVLKAVEPISMGAGVLPGNGDDGNTAESDGEIMYMRAKFERVVGSRDSEAFYMMNPDSNGAPELSIYLLRV